MEKLAHITIADEHAGQRLDNFLFNKLKGVPKGRVYRAIRNGEVRVNKGRIKPDYRLKSGDLIRIPPIRRPSAKKPPKVNPQHEKQVLSSILFENDELLVLNKFPGWAVHAGSGVHYGLIETLRAVRNDSKYELVHRLDRETSGCLVIAKNKQVAKMLNKQFADNEVSKTYWLLVSGAWKAGGLIDAPLSKNRIAGQERVVKIDPLGQVAQTKFKVLRHFGTKATWIEAQPITGRTHQIRVHATHAGHPIAGDPKYGQHKFNQEMKKFGIDRLFLHSRALQIRLPSTNEPLSFEAPLDEQLHNALQLLGAQPWH